MHKKLEAELMSLAHTILQMKNKNDVIALKEKARVLYERLSVLSFVDEYLSTTPNTEKTRASLISKIEEAVNAKPEEDIEEETSSVEKEENIETKDEKTEEITETVDEVPEEKVEDEGELEEVTEEETTELEMSHEEIVVEISTPEIVESKKKVTLEEEFKDSVSVDVTTNLFTKVKAKSAEGRVSLNDKLQPNIQVGLNDRIAFVKHLFNHSQADFNRVLSQLNSFKTEKEALNFINKMVKPDYNWFGKEEFEERFLTIVERKFL